MTSPHTGNYRIHFYTMPWGGSPPCSSIPLKYITHPYIDSYLALASPVTGLYQTILHTYSKLTDCYLCQDHPVMSRRIPAGVMPDCQKCGECFDNWDRILAGQHPIAELFS